MSAPSSPYAGAPPCLRSSRHETVLKKSTAIAFNRPRFPHSPEHANCVFEAPEGLKIYGHQVALQARTVRFTPPPPPTHPFLRLPFYHRAPQPPAPAPPAGSKKAGGGAPDNAAVAAPPLFSPALTKDAADAANDEEAYDAVEEEEEEEEEEEAFNPYLFIAGLPSHHTVVIRDKICLPPIKGAQTRPTLALDLDETLVHCTVEPIAKPDLTFPVTFNGTFYQVYVRKRPYLDYFLETVSKSFEVVVFTASQKVYADVLLDLLDPEHKFIEHRLFREACLFVQVRGGGRGGGRRPLSVLRPPSSIVRPLTPVCRHPSSVQGNYLKDLTVLGRDMTKVPFRLCILHLPPPLPKRKPHNSAM